MIEMLHEVRVIDLSPIADDRGWLMEISRNSTTGLAAKQVYVSVVKEGVVKDRHRFHCHRKQWDMFCCIKGNVKLVMVDRREDSPTRNEIVEILTGEDYPKLIIIPPGVLHAFQGLKGDCYVIDCVTEEYNASSPDEFRVDNTFYSWD